MFRGISGCVIASGIMACSADVADPSLVRDATGSPVIVTLRTRDRELSITATGEGARYGVLDTSGSSAPVWVADLSLDELRSFDIELHEIATAAMARHGSAREARWEALPAGPVRAERTASPRRF